MSKSKLDKEEQSRLKGISKALIIISKIARIGLYIGIVSLLLVMVIIPKAMNHVKVNENSIIFKVEEESLTLTKESSNKVTVYVNDKEEASINNVEVYNKVKKVFDNHSTAALIGYSEAYMLCTILYLYLIILSLKHFEKLFKNIRKGETPFTLDNVEHMRKMGFYMIGAIVLPIIISILYYFFTDLDINPQIRFTNIIEILFVFAMSSIFKYGYNLQADSKKTIYDDEEDE